ncbi:putative ribonuclease H-like domain-containing protein [Tanacetum coccineum]
MEAGTTSTTLTARLPILNPGEYDLWLMRIEQYFLMTDYSLWEVILNGNKVLKRTIGEVEQIYEPTSAEEMQDRRNEIKARGTLLMALPNKDQLKFHSYKHAKLLMEAIEKRLQKLISQLEIQGEVIEQEDMNLKLLRSLPSEWKTHALIWRNKEEIETISLDDLYNNLKIYEPELTGSTNNTAYEVSAAHTQSNSVNSTSVDNLSDAVICAFLASQPNSPQLTREDLEQIDLDDLDEIDLQWEMAMLTIRARRSKVECYNCHKNGHFASECKAPRNQENRGRENGRRTITVETPIENTLIAQDGIGGYDWSYQAEEEHPTNYALMAYTSSGSSSNSDSEVDSCSKTCLHSVEAGLAHYKKNEAVFEESINVLNLEVKLRDNALVENKKKLEKAEKERDELKLTLEKFQILSKSLNNLLESQVSDKFKKGLGYNVASPALESFVNSSEMEFRAPKPDLMFMDEIVESESMDVITDVTPSDVKRVESNHESTDNSDDESEVEFIPNVEDKTVRPSTEKIKFVKSARETVEKVIRPVWNNSSRVNHKNFANKITHPHPKRRFVPQAVLTKSGKLKTAGTKVNDVRLVNTVDSKPTVNHLRGNPQQKEYKEKGVIDSGCSRHMTGNKCYLTEYEDYDGGFVSFGDGKGRISRKVDESGALDKGGKDEQATISEFERLLQQEKHIEHINRTNSFNTVSTPVNAIGPSFTDDTPSSPVNAARTSEITTKCILKKHLYDKFLLSKMHLLFHMFQIYLPNGKRDIRTKWVFRNKKDERGIVVRNKARLVAQGYTQEEGIDYDEIFSRVAKIEATRLFLAYASFMGFIVYRMNVKSGFLYGTIEEEVYVCQPLGFEDPQFPNKVYKIEKALYGLHQAPIAWYETLSTYLLENRFRRGTIDKTLFIKKDKDDAQEIPDEFYGGAHFLFRIATSTPIETNKALLKDEEAEDVDVHLYRSMIGSLMYLTASRPDIMFAVCACARFQVTPKVSHLHVVKRIFRYLKGQPKLGLWYPKDSPFDLETFSDSDYAGASLDMKSTTGGCQFLGKRLISWQCKKHTIVANSTTEAEYVAATNCCGKAKRTTEISQSSGPIHLVADETVYKEWAERMERAATTASSLEAKQDIGNINRTQSMATLNESFPQGTDSGSGPRIGVDTARHKLHTTSIKYALTESPTIYVSLIEQFSQTASASTLENGDMEITAIIDGKVKVVSEASIRRHLKLEDSNGISTLPTSEIGNMKRASKGYTGVDTPLFQTMLVQGQILQGEGSTILVESHYTPISAPSTSQPPTSPPSMQTTHVAEEAATMPHDSPLLRVHSLGSDEGSMALSEFTVLCTILSKKVETLESDLKQTKLTYGAAYTKLIMKEKKLEHKVKSSKARRRIDEDEGITLVQMSAHTQGRHEHNFEEPDFKFIVLEEDYTVEPDIGTANVPVSTAGAEVSTASPEVKTAAESLKTKLQLEQERLGMEEALRLQEQLDEEERQRIARVHEEASTFNAEEWDNIQAQIEADEELAHRLQAQERERYSEADKARLLVELINERKRKFAQQRAEQRRNKPMTQAQQRTYMCNYIKNIGSHTLQQLKKLSFDEVKELFETTMKRVNTFTPMESDDTVPKVVAGSSKIDVEQELNQESSKRQKIGEGSEPAKESKDELSQEQLQQLMIIVPEEGMNNLQKIKKEKLLGSVEEVVFKPDDDVTIWKLQREAHDIFMLVEKDYPLTRALMTLMLSNKLQEDEYAVMADELLRKIFILANRPRQ